MACVFEVLVLFSLTLRVVSHASGQCPEFLTTSRHCFRSHFLYACCQRYVFARPRVSRCTTINPPSYLKYALIRFIFLRDSGDNGDSGDSGDSGDGNGTSSSTTTSTTTTSTDKNHHTSTSTSTSSTQTSSSFTTTPTTTGTLTSSGSVYTSSTSTSSLSSTQNNSTSTSSHGLSTAARTGLSFGISKLTSFELFTRRIDIIAVFFLILSAILFCYIRRRSRRARENASYEPALLSSEVRQYRPPDSTALTGGELPPPRLDTAHQDPHDISHSYPSSAISSVTPLLSDSSRANSRSTPSWNSNSALLQSTDIPQIATQQMSTLPNPHDPFPAPTRSASTMVSTVSSSPSPMPSGTSTPGNAATTSAVAAPGGSSSSTSHPQRRVSALHMDLARYQKELELDHRKQSLDAREEPQKPPPQYSS